ncbi:MAG: alanine racemase [Bacteroidales bacterium]|nr:alanine racemase [Bacteroidales bacterium]MCF8337048.1 alanine racemase [Bacteroidales bacterium]
MSINNLGIKTPTAIIDTDIVENNLKQMLAKAKENGLMFRPHFKTHQSGHIGEFFRARGIEKITVSSVMMAEYFASYGWNDITIAFPVNLLEMEEINRLAESIDLSLLVESVDTLTQLQEALSSKCGIFVKIDAGYRRTGVKAGDLKTISALTETIHHSPKTPFKGFIIHNGHSYNATSSAEILKLHSKSLENLSELYKWKEKHYPESVISLGDTPSLSIADNFKNVDEIRPGNFIFYDIMQHYLGSCSLEDVAMAVACPVVASHPERNEAVIYGGAVHLSKDSINHKGKTLYGRVAMLRQNDWRILPAGNYVKKLSQEHGVVHLDDGFIQQFEPGDLIMILPVHSCLVPSLLGHYMSTEGETLSVMKNYRDL